MIKQTSSSARTPARCTSAMHMRGSHASRRAHVSSPTEPRRVASLSLGARSPESGRSTRRRPDCGPPFGLRPPSAALGDLRRSLRRGAAASKHAARGRQRSRTEAAVRGSECTNHLITGRRVVGQSQRPGPVLEDTAAAVSLRFATTFPEGTPAPFRFFFRLCWQRPAMGHAASCSEHGR